MRYACRHDDHVTLAELTRFAAIDAGAGSIMTSYNSVDGTPSTQNPWLLNTVLKKQWHFGGFGKWNKDLLDFMNEFYKVNQIPLDIVYTSKMMYGIREMLDRKCFSTHERILCIHSGGLQGNASVKGELRY